MCVAIKYAHSHIQIHLMQCNAYKFEYSVQYTHTQNFVEYFEVSPLGRSFIRLVGCLYAFSFVHSLAHLVGCCLHHFIAIGNKTCIKWMRASLIFLYITFKMKHMITFSIETAYAATELYRNWCAHDTTMHTNSYTRTRVYLYRATKNKCACKGEQPNSIRIECEIEANT